MKNLSKVRIRALGTLALFMTIGWILFIVGYAIYVNTDGHGISDFWNNLTHNNMPAGIVVAEFGFLFVLICWICSIVYGCKILTNLDAIAEPMRKRASLAGIIGIIGGLLLTNIMLCFFLIPSNEIDKVI